LFNNNEIFVVKRDRLFYDKYEWSVSWQQDEITVLRNGTDPKKIARSIADREYWSTYRHGPMSTNWRTPFTTEVLDSIESVRQLLVTESCPQKTVFGYNSNITVYTSNQRLIDAILRIAKGTVTIRQAAVTRPRDTVELVDPTHKFRTYLRSTLVNNNSKQILANWVNAQGNAVRPGPALAYWLTNKRPRWKQYDGTERYFFFDHDSKMYETMLSIVLPSSVRKTVELIKKQ
jgi:hypothetical protein